MATAGLTRRLLIIKCSSRGIQARRNHGLRRWSLNTPRVRFAFLPELDRWRGRPIIVNGFVERVINSKTHDFADQTPRMATRAAPKGK